MKRLGIDYGEKNVGVALSDEGGSLAFPKIVLPNDTTLLHSLLEIIKKEHVEEIVVGESRNFKGDENPIMKRIKIFKETLEEASGKRVVFEPELFSTQEAKRGQEEAKSLDASAAAIILQSYIDKQS